MTLSDMMGRLILGTAGFGMVYGLRPIGRPATKPTEEDVHMILARAYASGIRGLDTAAAYGDAEAQIGRSGYREGFVVTTKVRPNLYEAPTLRLDASLALEREGSTRRLGGCPDGWLLHSARYAFRSDILDALLRCCRDFDTTRKIRWYGVSCYEPQEAIAAIESGMTAIQVPYNVLDRRFSQAGVLAKAKAHDVRVLLRQPFLQSLLLMSPDQLPAAVNHAAPWVTRFHELCHRQGMRPIEAALWYALATPPETLIVFGVETLAQLEEDLTIAATPPPSTFDPDALAAEFRDMPEAIVNPSRWGKGS